MNYNEKLNTIFENHGYSTQLKKLSEEVFELQEAVLDYFSFLSSGAYLRKPDSEEEKYLIHIEEEYADVMNIMNQIKINLTLRERNIIKIQKEKINRQCKRDGINEKVLGGSDEQ